MSNFTIDVWGLKKKPSQPSVLFQDSVFWRDFGRADLSRTLRRLRRAGLGGAGAQVARNVVIFVGDGMGGQTSTMARIYKGQKLESEGGSTLDPNGEGEELVWESFPAVGISKTYNTNRQVADSAGTATALFSGVKTRLGVIGVDATVPRNECDPRVVEKGKLRGMLHWAVEAGKDTGM